MRSARVARAPCRNSASHAPLEDGEFFLTDDPAGTKSETRTIVILDVQKGRQLQELDEQIKKEVKEAWDFADNSPEPPLEALYEDILVDTTSISRRR